MGLFGCNSQIYVWRRKSRDISNKEPADWLIHINRTYDGGTQTLACHCIPDETLSILAPRLDHQHWISIHTATIASFSVLFIWIMSTVFDCLWPSFVVFFYYYFSWNILQFILPFVLNLFSPPPSFLLPLFLFCSPLRSPPFSSSSAYDHQHTDGKPSSSCLLSVSHAFFTSCRTILSFQFDPFIQFHPLSLHVFYHFHLNV